MAAPLRLGLANYPTSMWGRGPGGDTGLPRWRAVLTIVTPTGISGMIDLADSLDMFISGNFAGSRQQWCVRISTTPNILHFSRTLYKAQVDRFSRGNLGDTLWNKVVDALKRRRVACYTVDEPNHSMFDDSITQDDIDWMGWCHVNVFGPDVINMVRAGSEVMTNLPSYGEWRYQDYGWAQCEGPLHLFSNGVTAHQYWANEHAALAAVGLGVIPGFNALDGGDATEWDVLNDGVSLGRRGGTFTSGIARGAVVLHGESAGGNTRWYPRPDQRRSIGDSLLNPTCAAMLAQAPFFAMWTHAPGTSAGATVDAIFATEELRSDRVAADDYLLGKAAERTSFLGWRVPKQMSGVDGGLSPYTGGDGVTGGGGGGGGVLGPGVAYADAWDYASALLAIANGWAITFTSNTATVTFANVHTIGGGFGVGVRIALNGGAWSAAGTWKAVKRFAMLPDTLASARIWMDTVNTPGFENLNLSIRDITSGETRTVGSAQVTQTLRETPDLTATGTGEVEVTIEKDAGYAYNHAGEYYWFAGLEVMGTPIEAPEPDVPDVAAPGEVDSPVEPAYLWPYMPQHGPLETLQWLTDVNRCRSAEQRFALRPTPRQGVSFDYIASHLTYSRMKSFARTYLHRSVLFPLWWEMSEVGGQAVGNSALTFDTRYAHYAVGDRIVVWDNETTFETPIVATLSTTGLTFDPPLSKNYVSACVAPVKKGRFTQPPEGQREAMEYVKVKASFITTEMRDLSDEGAYPVYRDHRVMTDRAFVLSGITDHFGRETIVIDEELGLLDTADAYTYPVQDSVMAWDTQTRAELWAIRQWLHSRRGRQKGFWLPSWNNDLEVVADITSGGSTITVKGINYPSQETIRDIMIRSTAGVNYYRRVLFGNTSGDNEILTLSAAAGVDLDVDEVEMICFLTFMRFDADRIEITHRTGHGASIAVTVMETPVP